MYTLRTHEIIERDTNGCQDCRGKLDGAHFNSGKRPVGREFRVLRLIAQHVHVENELAELRALYKTDVSERSTGERRKKLKSFSLAKKHLKE
jgi:hypothetical protein